MHFAVDLDEPLDLVHQALDERHDRVVKARDLLTPQGINDALAHEGVDHVVLARALLDRDIHPLTSHHLLHGQADVAIRPERRHDARNIVLSNLSQDQHRQSRRLHNVIQLLAMEVDTGHVHEQSLRALSLTQLILTRDKTNHGSGVSHNLPGDPTHGKKPGLGPLQRKGTVVELFLELAAFVLNAVNAHNRRQYPKLLVGSVHAHHADAVQQKPNALHKHRRLLLRNRIIHRNLQLNPLSSGLLGAFRRLRALDQRHHTLQKHPAVDPGPKPPVCLLLDQIHVENLGGKSRLPCGRNIQQPLSDLLKYSKHAYVARR